MVENHVADGEKRVDNRLDYVVQRHLGRVCHRQNIGDGSGFDAVVGGTDTDERRGMGFWHVGGSNCFVDVAANHHIYHIPKAPGRRNNPRRSEGVIKNLGIIFGNERNGLQNSK